MSLETQITSLATSVAAQCNSLSTSIGTLANLSTTNKANLVAALNELNNALTSLDVPELDDDASSGSDVTWSVDKIKASIAAAIAGLVDGAPGVLDTLNELAAALGDDPDVISDILSAQALRVRVDASQSFDGTQQAQGRANIGAQSAAAIGNTDRDFAADFTGALT